MVTRASIPSTSSRTIGAVTIALAFGCGFAGLVIVDASLAANAFSPVGVFDEVRHLAPQGWAFFTRDPQLERTVVMVETADGWVSAEPGANALPRHAFGFDRAARAHGLEKGLVMQQLPPQPWPACSGEIEACLRDAAVQPVTNSTPGAALCGTLAFVRQKPVPWAWSRSGRDVSMPTSIAKAEVRC